MRALAQNMCCSVTVPAQYAIPGREFLFSQQAVLGRASAMALRSALARSLSVDVIERKKYKVALSTAGARATISVHSLSFELVAIPFLVYSQLLAILARVLTMISSTSFQLGVWHTSYGKEPGFIRYLPDKPLKDHKTYVFRDKST